MSDKEESIDKAAAVAIELDMLASVMADLVVKFNEKVDEANDLIGELEAGEDDVIEPDFLAEFDMSDCDPADFGDELRLAFSLPLKNGKPSKYAPGPSKGQFESYAHKPITEDEFAVNKAKAEDMAVDMGIAHPHTGKLFELGSYRYFLVGMQDDVLLAVRARNGVLHKFEGLDAEKILGKLDMVDDAETKAIL